MNAPPDLDWLARLREQLLAIEPDMATDEQLLFDTIDGQSEVIDQLRSIVRHGIEAEVFADALARHIKTLEQRRSRFEARSDACRSTVRNAMETLGLTALKAEDLPSRSSPAGRASSSRISTSCRRNTSERSRNRTSSRSPQP